jgi:NADP-dependent 3-hydroxy acid dehydrogenase YdfG
MGLAVITGGSRGLGFETARALKEKGHEVLLVAKDPVRLAASAEKLGCQFRVVDLEDLASSREVFSEILQTYGAPELLILAHGVMSEKMSKTLRTTNE